MAGLFEEVNTNKPISRGSLVAFQYPYSQSLDPNIIHDPSPLILITDIWPRHIRGVNLHYLTFPYIKKILQGHCENAGFSYGHIRGDKYVAGAFRMYVRTGMRMMKRLDCAWLLDLLSIVRNYSPNELDMISDQIRAQIQSRLQAKASEINSYEEWRNNMLQGRVNTEPVNTPVAPDLAPNPTSPTNINPTPNTNIIQ